MDFKKLDGMMRRFETQHDNCIVDGVWMIARF